MGDDALKLPAMEYGCGRVPIFVMSLKAITGCERCQVRSTITTTTRSGKTWRCGEAPLVRSAWINGSEVPRDQPGGGQRRGAEGRRSMATEEAPGEIPRQMTLFLHDSADFSTTCPLPFGSASRLRSVSHLFLSCSAMASILPRE